MPDTLLATKTYPGGRTLVAVTGDLLKEPTEGIVNAANGHLAHGGGVAATIARAAGAALEAEGDRIIRERGAIPVGGAVLTTAGALPFLGVIHAVGPRFGEGDEEAKLAKAMLSAFTLANDHGWESLSFPAVSSGIFGVPLDACARAYVAAADTFFGAHAESPLKTLRLVLFPGPIVDAVKTAMTP